jgi:prepilin-type N-terminal cleavage/methylation domain-containing protein
MVSSIVRFDESLATVARRGRHAERACYSGLWPLASGPGRRSRPGFTLVELLVVITIIIILMGLLTPVVINALTRAKETRILTEINLIDSAFKKYKADMGATPPSDFTNIGTAKYAGGNPYTPVFSFTPPPSNSPQLVALANHLQKAFPRCNVYNEIGAIICSSNDYLNKVAPAPISPAQAIVFWLSGFCTDKEHPISGLLTIGAGNAIVVNPNAPRDAGPLEFDRTRWKIVGNSLTPVYCAADTPGVPYVYFASQSYLLHAATYAGRGNLVAGTATPFDASAWNQGGQGIVRPYGADPPPENNKGTFAGFVNPSSFQIISAGLDSDFGGGGVMDNNTSDATANKLPVLPYYNSGTWYATGDRDNLTNFGTSNTLGDSIPR